MKKTRQSSSTVVSRLSKSLETEGADEEYIQQNTKTEKPVNNINSIEFVLDNIDHINAIYQVTYVYVKTEYKGQIIDISENTLVMDEKVKLNWSFYLDINVLSEKELDDLVSKPIIFTAYQVKGDFNVELFEEMKIIGDDSAKQSFDSSISIYEKFTDEILQDKEYAKELMNQTKLKKKSTSKELVNLIEETKTKDKGKGKKDKTLLKKKEEPSSKLIEENSSIIGVATLDMLPIILGNQSFNGSVAFKPIIINEDETMITYKNIPKMCVNVTIDTPIEFKVKPSILSFTLESIYNIPAAMANPDLECRVCAWLPLNDSLETKQVFGNAIFKIEESESEYKAWPNLPIIGNNANGTTYRIRKDFSNVRSENTKNISNAIKTNNPKLIFNYIKRNILNNASKNVLRNYLQRYRSILLEIFLADPKDFSDLNTSLDDKKPRRSVSSLKITEKKPPKRSGFLHLMALLDISSLIYPGVTSIRVAAQLATYQDKEILKTTGIHESHFMLRTKASPVRTIGSEKTIKTSENEKNNKKKDASNASSSLKKGGGSGVVKEKEDKENLKSNLPSPPIFEVEEEPSMKIFNENGDPTIVIIEIELDEALAEARPIQDLIVNLREIIPAKPNLGKIKMNSKSIEDDYKIILREIITDLNENYNDYNEDKEICRCEPQADFQTYLHRSGLYQKYTLRLREIISPLLNIKYDFLQPSLKSNNKKHQEIIGNFYCYLVTQMNTILNKEKCASINEKRMNSCVNAELLYAKEACGLKQYTLAEKYFQQRISLDQNNPDGWFDYAIYHLEMDSPEVAFECLHEALSRQPDHVNSLLLYGILLAEKEKKSDAETCFMTVLVHRPRWVEVWGVLFLFHKKLNNTGGMIFAEDMADQYINDLKTSKDYFMNRQDLAWTSEILPNTVFFRTAALLLRIRMYSWVEDALSLEVINHPGKVHYLLAAICYYQENYDHGLQHLYEAKSIEGWNYGIVPLAGHCLMWKQQYKEAIREYFFVLNGYNRPKDMHLLYINCAKALKSIGEIAEAKKIILKACENNPTPYTWLTAGTYYYQQNDLISAEECFTQANMWDNHIPEVWGFLALINLKQDHFIEAELCYQQALKNELSDTNMIITIGEEFHNYQKRKVIQ